MTSLTHHFKSKKRIFSLELSSKREVNFVRLSEIKFAFCSIIWIGKYECKPDKIEPLIMARQLIAMGYTVLLHLPARCVTRKSVRRILEYCIRIGLKNLMIVRGASPECKRDEEYYEFPYPPSLIRHVRKHYRDYFDIVVTGYPNTHPECSDMNECMQYLKKKVEAGAKYVLTQATFNYESYLHFLTSCKKSGVHAKIIPGMYIMTSAMDFSLMKKLCKVPPDSNVTKFLKDHKGDEAAISKFGLETSVEMSRKLLENTDFCPPHIFTMNELDHVQEFLDAIAIKSNETEE